MIPAHLLRLLGQLTLALLFPLAAGNGAAASQSGPALLRAAWIATGTGRVTADPRRPVVDTPLDLQLVEAIAVRAGLGVIFEPMERGAAAAALAAGEVDVLFPVADATPPVSRPYSVKRDVILCARNLDPLGATGLAALKEAYARGLRVGIVGDAPHGAEVSALAAAAGELTIRFASADLALAGIVTGRAHCILAPRLAILGALATNADAETVMARQPVDIAATALRLRFSSDVPSDTVAAVDAAIAALSTDGTLRDIERKAGRPVLFRFAVAKSWFDWFDVIGTIAFALSGVLIARSENFSLLGAFVLATLPAVGGGVIRDLLVDRSPIGILGDPRSLMLVGATVLAAYCAGAAAGRFEALRQWPARRLPRALSPAMALEVTDALGLAAFTVIGVSVAVRTGAEPLWLWGPALAAIGGAGGGILRDLLRSGYENPALRTSFYAEVCVLWGGALTMATIFLLPDERPALLRYMVALTILGAFITRMMVVTLKLRSPRF